MSDAPQTFTLNQSWPTASGGVIAFTVRTPEPVPAEAYPLLAELSEVASRVAEVFSPAGVGVGEHTEEKP